MTSTSLGFYADEVMLSSLVHPCHAPFPKSAQMGCFESQRGDRSEHLSEGIRSCEESGIPRLDLCLFRPDQRESDAKTDYFYMLYLSQITKSSSL